MARRVSHRGIRKSATGKNRRVHVQNRATLSADKVAGLHIVSCPNAAVGIQRGVATGVRHVGPKKKKL